MHRGHAMLDRASNRNRFWHGFVFNGRRTDMCNRAASRKHSPSVKACKAHNQASAQLRVSSERVRRHSAESDAVGKMRVGVDAKTFETNRP